ncbi:unnamed protein product [Caenorhabditis brenneri]
MFRVDLQTHPHHIDRNQKTSSNELLSHHQLMANRQDTDRKRFYPLLVLCPPLLVCRRRDEQLNGFQWFQIHEHPTESRLLANASPPPPAQRAPITPDTPFSNGTDARGNRDLSPLAQQGRQQAIFGTRDPTGSPQEARSHTNRQLADRPPSPPPAKRARPSDPVQNGFPQRSQSSAPQAPPPQRYNNGFSSRRPVQPV